MTSVYVTSCEKRLRKIETKTYVCVTSLIENGNGCLCAVAINTEANIENNLQLESFSSLFKLFRVTVLLYKFLERLKLKYAPEKKCS